ncbi:hypothetical protein [Actinocrispum wychmicini]|uniref:Uncharacterized protein n=1 Tax=Actinocrispum wychmicini TaxID=1213861 RepID=A0A4R2JWR8_9PSEU|nr:hypothetical protein [Actinocrispum wychmicini]TCO64951.1 hypothetical protein EV192_101735 [Actinocrispum wychmicini]
MPLISSISLAVNAELTTAADLKAIPKCTLAYSKLAELATGTGVGQADKLWFDQRTLAAGANEDLDLAGVLADIYGQAVTFARIKALVVAAVVANTNNVVIGAAASNQWATLLGTTGTVTLRPGAFFAAVAGSTDATGYAVTAGTGDLLRVTNSAGGSTVDYEITIIGASA